MPRNPRFRSGFRQIDGTQLVGPPGRWRPPAPPEDVSGLPHGHAIPVVMGSDRVWPVPLTKPRLAPGATGASLVSIVKTFGRGPGVLTNLRMGDEDMVPGTLTAGSRQTIKTGAWAGVVYEVREGRGSDTDLSLYPEDLGKASINRAITTTASSFSTKAGSTQFALRFKFGNGISRKVTVNGKSKQEALAVTLSIAWSSSGGVSGATTATYNGADDTKPIEVEWGPFMPNSDGVGRTWSVSLAVVRLATLTGATVAGTPNTTLTHLTSFGPKSIGGGAGLIQIGILGDLDTLGGDPLLQNLNAEVAVELKETVSGSATATRNPSAAFLDILQGAANPEPVANGRIDSTAISAWKSACATAGYSFDYTFGQDGGQGTILDALNLVAKAGRARAAIIDGRYTVIREPSGSPVELFCPANMRDGFTVHREAFAGTLHGVRVTIRNRANGFLEETFVVYASGFSSSTAERIEDWTFDGVTSRNVAADLAAYHLAVLAERSLVYEFATDIEHLRVTRGDLVRVAHYRIGKGTSWGRVTAIPTSTVLRVSRPCTMATGGSYRVLIRNADGTQTFFAVTTAAGEQVELTTTGAHGAAVGDLFVFGVSADETETCVVLKVEHGDDLAARLTVAPWSSATGSVSGNPSPGTANSTALSPPSLSVISTAGGITLGQVNP